MRKYKLVEPTQYEKDVCRLFAKACVDTNKDEYARRNQNDINKIVSDIYNGKLAEIMVYRLFKKKKHNPTAIDFLIYDKDEKSFDADMLTTKHNVHIKSCKNDSPFPNSWVFQPWDKLVVDPSDNDIIVLVVMGKKNYCYIIPSTKAVYESPVKKSLNKKVIYEESL